MSFRMKDGGHRCGCRDVGSQGGVITITGCEEVLCLKKFGSLLFACAWNIQVGGSACAVLQGSQHPHPLAHAREGWAPLILSGSSHPH